MENSRPKRREPSISEAGPISRRSFLATASAVSLTSGVWQALSRTNAAPAPAREFAAHSDTPMQYRILGSTGLTLSEIGMGGHAYQLERLYKYYSGQKIIDESVQDEETYSEFYEERTRQVACALDSGINFFDPTNDREVRSLATALKRLGRQNDCHVCGDFIRARYHDEKTPQELADSLVEHIGKTIRVLGREYVDLVRISTFEQWSLEDLEGGIGGFHTLQKQGRALFFGISSHDPEYLIRAIKRFPEINFVVTPYSFAHQAAAKELFPLCQQRGVGVITIKPFAGGAFFLPGAPKGKKTLDKWVAPPPAETMDHLKSEGGKDLAQANLRFILSNSAITTVIPGMNKCDEILNNVHASGQGELSMGTPLTEALRVRSAHARRQLPSAYRFLNQKWSV